MSLEGQDIPISNTSSPSMFSSTTMGEPQCRFHGSNPNTNRITKKEITHNCLSEEELVALWVGVRRYGAGNWDAILGDPFLNCLKRKPKRIYPRGGTISYA
ncbi:hypothetical protein L6164_022871 [Bauhinia variegata]|uniref:Uncharacterized protein n=1 Tax=Bauhinia variegata TaxID=167791 RepID=A0ACB9MHF2_BAUVA|nr:hypothetical protein L6164_022871 [Bauhinia variegata]